MRGLVRKLILHMATSSIFTNPPETSMDMLSRDRKLKRKIIRKSGLGLRLSAFLYNINISVWSLTGG